MEGGVDDDDGGGPSGCREKREKGGKSTAGRDMSDRTFIFAEARFMGR